jgi:tetratricopeptide (TPR) repeat protein
MGRLMSGWTDEGPLPPARRAVEIAGDLGLGEQIESRSQLENALFHMGRVPEALRMSEENLEFAKVNRDLDLQFFGNVSAVNNLLWRQGCLLMWSGHPREAAASFESSLDDPGEGEEGPLAWLVGTWYGPPFEELTGTSTEALARCQRAFEFAERVGAPFARMFAWLYLGWAQLMRGQHAEALESLLHADHLQREREIGVALWNLGQGLLAEAFLAAGDGASARTVANRCTAERDMWVFELRANLSRSRVLRALDGADAQREIESSLGRAEHLLGKSRARAFAPFIIEERARLAEALGDAEGAAQHLREAQHAFAQVEATGHAERLVRELGS